MHNQEIKLRINSELKKRLIDYCKENNTTYAELVRDLIKDKLDVEVVYEKLYKVTVTPTPFDSISDS